jgi:hypothetical protein
VYLDVEGALPADFCGFGGAAGGVFGAAER